MVGNDLDVSDPQPQTFQCVVIPDVEQKIGRKHSVSGACIYSKLKAARRPGTNDGENPMMDNGLQVWFSRHKKPLRNLWGSCLQNRQFLKNG